MRSARAPLERRLAELEEFDPQTVEDRSDPRISSLEDKLDTTLVEIFGADSIEYRRYRRLARLDRAGYGVMRATPLPEIRVGLERGRADAMMGLQTIIDLFQERLDGAGETHEGRALRAIENLDLHAEIERAAGKLYRDGHFANSVEEACKALSAFVRFRSGVENLDGAKLMRTGFSLSKPILAFNDLSDDSDRSEQEGMMHLYEGAMLALRNPRAHRLTQDDPERALEYIGFVSLLAKCLDNTKRL